MGDTMKMVQAIIRPERLDGVKKALEAHGFIALSITEMRGRGEQKGILLSHRGRPMEVDVLPKVKLELVVNDEHVESIVSIIRGSARTGKFGDGKIFILPVDMMCKVRTDEVWK
jgi:nitrogen regulatory protein P-II 1